MLLEPGATVTVGGAAPSNVVVDPALRDRRTCPPSRPERLTTSSSGTRADFGHARERLGGRLPRCASGEPVPRQSSRLVANQVSAGIGGGFFGVDDPVRRQAMAVFLLKAEHGSATCPRRDSRRLRRCPLPVAFADWIEAISAEGITGGCGGACTARRPVRRDQMAPSSSRRSSARRSCPALHGGFEDVPVRRFRGLDRGAAHATAITAGCGGNNYCPFSNNARGQMAAFISRTFSLQ